MSVDNHRDYVNNLIERHNQLTGDTLAQLEVDEIEVEIDDSVTVDIDYTEIELDESQALSIEPIYKVEYRNLWWKDQEYLKGLVEGEVISNLDRFNSFIAKLELLHGDNFDIKPYGFTESRRREFNVYLLYPELTIRNNENKSHVIRYMFVYFTIDFCTYKLVNSKLKGCRFMHSKSEISSNYTHSHLNNTCNSTDFSDFCLGKGPLKTKLYYYTLHELNSDIAFQALLLLTKQYLQYEALEGTRYSDISNVKPKLDLERVRYIRTDRALNELCFYLLHLISDKFMYNFDDDKGCYEILNVRDVILRNMKSVVRLIEENPRLKDLDIVGYRYRNRIYTKDSVNPYLNTDSTTSNNNNFELVSKGTVSKFKFRGKPVYKCIVKSNKCNLSISEDEIEKAIREKSIENIVNYIQKKLKDEYKKRRVAEMFSTIKYTSKGVITSNEVK